MKEVAANGAILPSHYYSSSMILLDSMSWMLRKEPSF